MMIFDRYTGKPVWSQFCIYSRRLIHWLVRYWFTVLAVAILLAAAILSLLAFVDAAFIQIGDADRPISSALFFSDCTNNGSAPPFYGYRLALFYNFGCRLAQQAI